MKKLVVAGLLLGSSVAHADGTLWVGVSYTFDTDFRSTFVGGQLGYGVKWLIQDKEDSVTPALGVTYYPKIKDWGADMSVAITGNDFATTYGYDFLQELYQVGVGHANTEGSPKPQEPIVEEPEEPETPEPEPPTEPPVDDCKYGYGYGDKNHCHIKFY